MTFDMKTVEGDPGFVKLGASQDEISSTITFIETRLIPALTSGRYKQSMGALRRGSGPRTSYCCLGLACNLQSRHEWGTPGRYSNASGWRGGDYSDVIDLLDIEKFPMPALSKSVLYTLAYMNDSSESFLSIASSLLRDILPKLREALK